jgi:rhodanese-related sulfurtransferase
LIPLGELAERDDELARPPDRSRSRATQATVILKQVGFTDVRHLSGGMLRWCAEGHPVQGGSA